MYIKTNDHNNGHIYNTRDTSDYSIVVISSDSDSELLCSQQPVHNREVCNELTTRDLQTLKPGQWLNDQVKHYGIVKWWLRMLLLLQCNWC